MRLTVQSLLVRLGLGMLVGGLAAGSAVGVGEFVAAFIRPAASPVIAVGNKFILLTPESLKEYAIRKFGTNDKHMLLLGIYTAIGALAVVVGVLAIRWLWAGMAGLLAFGAVGVWAATTANAARASDAVPSVIATVVAVAALVVLVRASGRGNQWPLPARLRASARQRTGATAEDVPAASGAAQEPVPPASQEPVSPASRQPAPPVPASRRTFLAGGVTVAAVAVAGGVGGRALQHSRFDAGKSRAAVRLPKPASPAPPLPPGAELGKGAVPFITTNKDFYRVDTALAIPQLTTDSWSLRIHGRVDHPLTISYDDLIRRPLIERYITMTCVSDVVGGPYVSTAKFLGAPLADLLREAGVHSDADQIVGRSSDGMTIGTPTAVIMDGRDAMLAVGMNDEPLPLAHGFPVRMLVPGLYGYVSATKWLVDLEATTFADYDTYWVQRKWAPRAPIRLESRIDTPVGLSRPRIGQRVNIAGIAWHQHTGVGAVQVKIGDADWQEARLGRVPSADTWVQWVLPWTVSQRGLVTLQVRAVDKDGNLQDEHRRGVFPSGASGWHSIVVNVQ